MHMPSGLAPIAAIALACLALPAVAADRVHAGQWESTWTGGGRSRTVSNCMTQGDADAMNGDAKAVRAYLEKIIPPSICKLSDIQLSGGKIVYTSVCNGATNVITTTYHGDSFESTTTTGVTSTGKLTGACK
jgi:hypothetical protein